MKVGLDLDFTITEMPEFFSLLTKALLQEKHEVHIITYRDMDIKEDTMADLKQYGIKYTALHLPPPDQNAPEWKARMAVQLDLDMLFDDSPEVLAVLPEKCKRIWVCDQMFDLGVCVKALKKAKMERGVLV